MKKPGFEFEKKLYQKGFRTVAGMDEVGRGCFAGPIVAAACVFAPNSKFKLSISAEFSKRIIINDSKKLTPGERERAYFWIRKNALVYGIGKGSVAQINKFGIKKASEIAFRKAIKNCGKKIDFLLMDAFFVPYLRGLRRKNQMAIVKGDTKSVSIAAASIIAKVHRDKLMSGLEGKIYRTSRGRPAAGKKYGWGRNKGYGTKEHREAILRHGTTSLHRKKFVETFIRKLT